MHKTWVALSIPLGLILVATSREAPTRAERVRPPAVQEADRLTARLDQALEAHWAAEGVEPAPVATDLAFARRLWLDLLGTIPSLAEVREIEARPAEGRRAWLVDRALADPRFPWALAGRLARVVVGDDSKVDDLLYRRRKLVSWLAGELARHRPWDELVRELVAAEGLSTSHAPVNFIRAQEKDPIKLAARTTRAFLGVRIDCAQCHDHPFTDWKQGQFHGLAAFFARVEQNAAGISERPRGEYWLEPGGTGAIHPDEDGAAPRGPAGVGHGAGMQERERGGMQGGLAPAAPAETSAPPGYLADAPRRVAPAVPYAPELLPGDPHRRRALAAWITDPHNRYFPRAIVNRLWGWLMGRPFVFPVDELDVNEPRAPEVLDLLAADLVEHGFQLERTVRAIALTRAYALDSRPREGSAGERELAAWAVHPLEQLAAPALGAATLQATSFWTWDERRGQLLRLAHFGNLNDFLRRHGEDPDAEAPEAETLLQRLHLMNGQVLRERIKADDPFAAVVRVAMLARDDEAALETVFLMALTRRPTAREREALLPRLHVEKGQRAAALADVFWALVNSTEFAWNH